MMEKTDKPETVQTWALWGEAEETALLESQKVVQSIKAGPLCVRQREANGTESRVFYGDLEELKKRIGIYRKKTAQDMDEKARKAQAPVVYDLTPVVDKASLPFQLPEKVFIDVDDEISRRNFIRFSKRSPVCSPEHNKAKDKMSELAFFDEKIAKKAPPIDSSTLRASFWCLLAPGLTNMLFDTLSLPLPFPAGSVYTTLAAAYLVLEFQGHTEKQKQRLKTAKMAYTFLRDAENIPLSEAADYVEGHKKDLPSLSNIMAAGRKQVANEILQAVLEPKDALRAMHGKGPRPAPVNG